MSFPRPKAQCRLPGRKKTDPESTTPPGASFFSPGETGSGNTQPPDTGSKEAAERVREPVTTGEGSQGTAPQSGQGEKPGANTKEAETQKTETQGTETEGAKTQPVESHTAITEEKIDEIKDKISFNDKMTAAALVLKRLSSSDIKRLTEMVKNGLSSTEKAAAVSLVYERFSEEEVKLIKDMYYKYMGN